MAENNNNQSEEGKKFSQRVERLASSLNISIGKARKMLFAEEAKKIFNKNKGLQEWEKENFPDPNKVDPNDN